MSKKFFDIIPPGKVKKEVKKEIKLPKSKKIFLKGLILCLFFLALLSVLAFLFFSKIKIEIWPEVEILELKSKEVIPGKVLEDIRPGSQEFSASGETLKKEKARGKIRVYNTYSTSPRTLIPSRFVSTEGKLFWSVEKIVIPGARSEKGKLIPGEIDVEVVAAEAGQDYNIGPSTFALPALAGTSLYTTIYGKSFSPMTGGFKGEVSQVSQEDLEKAEHSLRAKLEKESKEFLKTTLDKDFILLDEAITQEVVEKNSSQKAGTEAESFIFQVKVKSEGLAFKRIDLENFAKNFITSAIPKDKKFDEESLVVDYSFESIDLESARITLNLGIKTKIYSDIDLAELKKGLLGKTLRESRIFLENLPEITKIVIKSWPFWKKRVPENIEKIEIRLNLD